MTSSSIPSTTATSPPIQNWSEYQLGNNRREHTRSSSKSSSSSEEETNEEEKVEKDLLTRIILVNNVVL